MTEQCLLGQQTPQRKLASDLVMRKQLERRADVRLSLLLVAQWGLMLLLAKPLGGAEFAINDDWAQQQAMVALVQHGRLVIPDWTATNFIGQLVWAAPWAWIAGPSFEVLRCSGMLAGLVGVLAFYGVLRQLQAAPVLAVVVAALLAAHPIYQALSASFMTDVPFIAASLLALWCTLRYHRHGLARDFVGLVVFASWALLIRQTGFALFVGFALAHGVQAREGARRRAACVLVWGVVLLAGYPALLAWADRLPAMRDAASAQMAATLALPLDVALRSVSRWFLNLLLYLGMAAAPSLLAMAILRWRGTRWRHLRIWVVLVSMALVFGWWVSGVEAFRMPMLGSDWAASGLGQRQHVGKLTDSLALREHFWTAMTIATVAGTVVALGVLVRAARRRLAGGWRDGNNFAAVLLSTVLLLQWAPLLLLTHVYDRYALPLLPVFLALLVWGSVDRAGAVTAVSREVKVALCAMVGAASLLAAALLHDYFAWHRVRWDWLRVLPAELGVAPTEIQGGFEYSAQLHYRGGRSEAGPHGWFMDPQRYEISMGPLRGRDTVAVRPVVVWLPFSPSQVYLTRWRY